MDKKNKISYRKARNWEHQFYCPYCKRELTYLFISFRDGFKTYLGLALDKWLHCGKCKLYFKIGSDGFREQELELNSSQGDVEK